MINMKVNKIFLMICQKLALLRSMRENKVTMTTISSPIRNNNITSSIRRGLKEKYSQLGLRTPISREGEDGVIGTVARQGREISTSLTSPLTNPLMSRNRRTKPMGMGSNNSITLEGSSSTIKEEVE